MFIVRAAFWFTAVLLVVPREGAFGIRADAQPAVMDSMRTSVLASLERVKAELAAPERNGDGKSM